MENHFFIVYDKTRVGTVTEVAFSITDFFLKGIQNRRKWKNDKKLYTVNWGANNEKQSKPINYRQIAEYIRVNGFFECSAFNLPKIECFWLDFSIPYKIDFHLHDISAPEGLTIIDGIPQQQYGKNYPIKPNLAREGLSFTSLQPQLLERIVNLRSKLIENSHLCLKNDWFFDLRALISDVISIVEITLTQFYIKAEFDPLPNWKFNKLELGEKHGRRLNDKLNWIYKITGNTVDTENYIESFNTLRELRNHLTHFDPPSLVITIEEATNWINQIIDVGYLLTRIRKAIGAENSVALLNFLLQKEAVFVPKEHSIKRLPLDNINTNYASSTWRKN